MAALLERPPFAFAHCYAPHGQGLPLLLPVAAARTGTALHLRRVWRLSARCAQTAFHPPHQRRNGALRWQPDLPETRFGYAQLRFDPGNVVSEQRLYDETTAYIETYYNRARILNRSAARLAMSIFQRRLASSTYALMRSFERRLEKLEKLIADIRSGKLSLDALQSMQRKLESLQDPLDEKTADEEDNPVDGGEEVEAVEAQLLAGLVAVSLADLEAERIQVSRLLELARKVYDQGQESKFERLRQILRDPQFQKPGNEKMIIFTEHRDTLEFLVRRLEGIGYTGQVAQIHGGMSTQPDPATGLSERDEQVEFFRRPANQDGARFLVATDAAGEGINLQFCWLMINYDIPWNPARLEQRMGRIHRYKQTHDPVVILNLVAGKTREGRVLKTLLEKLERIRKELGSDKVFDVVGRLFEGVSLRAYMERIFTEQDAAGEIKNEYIIQETVRFNNKRIQHQCSRRNVEKRHD